MVSHQLVYVTGMLEVILAPSDPSGRLRPPAKFSWYLAILAGVPDAFPTPRNLQTTCLGLSEASETFSGAFLSFPTRRKRSAARF